MSQPPAYEGPAAAASVIMSPTLRECAVVFVEGICETKLLSHHFPDAYNRVIPCGGFLGVMGAIETAELWEAKNQKKLMYIGFIDRDYSDTSEVKSKVVTSNYRDIEIDIYETKAPVRLLVEKASKPKCPNPAQIVPDLMKELRLVGLIRKYNSENKLAWNINSIPLEKCFDLGGKFSTDKYYELLAQKNFLKPNDLKKLKEWVSQGESIPLNRILRGHDISTLLGKLLRRKIGNRLSEETTWQCVEENLRLSTRPEELHAYDWMNSINHHLNQ